MSGVSITTSTSRVEVNTTSSTINIVPVGQQGIQGPVGPGVAAGGVAGDILVKTNSTNYATEWTDDITVDSITYDINAGIDPDTQGETAWSADERTLQINKGGGVLQYVSQDLSYPVVRNADTVTLTAGKLVMVDPSQPAQGQRLRVVRMNNNGTYPSDLFVGMVIETIAANQTGFVKWFGQVKNLSLPTLQPVGETWAEGDILWPSTTVIGGMTKVEPSAPSNKISVAAVLRISGNNLNLLLRPNLRSKLVDLHDVQVTNPSNGQILNYSNGVWVNATNAPDGVQSVTGDGVGGTATNVVMTFPTPAEIGAYPDTNPNNYITSAQAPVQSVNGQTNVVVLDADDVGAYSNTNPSSFINAAGAPVQSVTGTLVTGTSANPVVNIPTVDQVGAYSNTNPSNFVNVTQAAAAAPVQSVTGSLVTGTSSNVIVNAPTSLSNLTITNNLNVAGTIDGAYGTLPNGDNNSVGTNLVEWTKFKKILDRGVEAGTLYSNPMVSTYSLVYTAAGAYNGGVLAPNGDIHFVPLNANRGQKINMSGVVSTYSLVYTAADAYIGGVLAPNGDIYFVSANAVVGQKIDASGVVSTYSLVYTTAAAYVGGVLAPNGDIYFVPANAVVGQKIDASGVVSTYSLVYTTTNAYSGGVLAPNGDIHFVPRSGNRGQKISASGVVSTYSLVYTTTNAYIGGVLAPNGDIHFVPASANRGQKIDINGVVSTYSLVYTTGFAYYAGVLMPNGDIHFVPFSAAVGQKIDASGVVSTYSLVYTAASAYRGGVLMPNGDIYFVPANANRGQIIHSQYGEGFTRGVCMSPFLNKF